MNVYDNMVYFNYEAYWSYKHQNLGKIIFIYGSAIVTSTSTPGSIEIEVICLTISDGEWRSITRLWILIYKTIELELKIILIVMCTLNFLINIFGACIMIEAYIPESDPMSLTLLHKEFFEL